jgi:pterin-4a-carbinolamine dehydratase
MAERISPSQFHESRGVEDWRVLGEGACTFFQTGSFAPGARLVQSINELSGLAPHQPDIDLRHDSVTVRSVTVADDYYGMATRDVAFWFERMENLRADGGGAVHVAVWVPHDQAEARIAAALAAGGPMVRDRFAPAWWTLADSAGNEVDIATTRGRS